MTTFFPYPLSGVAFASMFAVEQLPRYVAGMWRRRRRQPAAVTRRASAVDKVVLTNRGALEAKYGRKTAAVDQAIAELVAADLARNLKTVLVAVDDSATMKRLGGRAVTEPHDPAQCKAAVDAVYHRLSPDYLLLLGSIDVLPHQPLRNPVHDGVNDIDPLAPSDLPYACNAPFSDDPTDFIGPDRVVGRLPDVVGAKDPKVLLKLLATAATWTSRPRADFEHHLGITAKAWERSTVLSLRKLFGAAEVHTSPAEGPAWTAAWLQRRIHFINCHGAEGDAQFYGQQGTDYPVSLRASDITGHVAQGTVVAAECCYGAQLWGGGRRRARGHGVPAQRCGRLPRLDHHRLRTGRRQRRRRPGVPVLLGGGPGGCLTGARRPRSSPALRAGGHRAVAGEHQDPCPVPAARRPVGVPGAGGRSQSQPARSQDRPPSPARTTPRARHRQPARHQHHQARQQRRRRPRCRPTSWRWPILRLKLFSVALPPLAAILPPPPQTALDAQARIRVVLGRAVTPLASTPPASTPSASTTGRPHRRRHRRRP